MGETDWLMYPAQVIMGPGSRRSSTSSSTVKSTARMGGLVKTSLKKPPTVVFFPARVPERSMSRMPADWTNRVLAK